MADGVATTGIGPLAGASEVLTTENFGLKGPLRGFRFTASFGTLGTSSFKSVTGFSVNVDSSTYREGGSTYLTARKLPGLVNYDDITLEKGMYDNPLLYNFFNGFLEGNSFTPVEGKIIIYDNAGNPTASWTVINAWPTSYRGGDLSAEDSSILVESLTLAHEGIRRDITVAAG